jgi:hypothetical protein
LNEPPTDSPCSPCRRASTARSCMWRRVCRGPALMWPSRATVSAAACDLEAHEHGL